MFSWQFICFPYGQVLTIWYKLNGTNGGFSLLSWHQKIYTCIKITLSTIFQGWFFINAILSAVLSLFLLKNVPEIFTAHLTTVSGNTANLLNKAADIQQAQNYPEEFSITYSELHKRLRSGRGGERCLTLPIHRQTELNSSLLHCTGTSFHFLQLSRSRKS